MAVRGSERAGLGDAPSGRYVNCAAAKLTMVGEGVRHLGVDATVEWLPDNAPRSEIDRYCSLLSTREDGINPNGEYRMLTSEDRAATVDYGWSINDASTNPDGSLSGPVEGSISSPPALDDIRSAIAEPLLESVEADAALCDGATAKGDQEPTSDEDDTTGGSEQETTGSEPDTASTVDTGDGVSPEALAIASALILLLLGTGTLVVQRIGRPGLPPLIDADGNPLIVQDGTYQGGTLGQVWYGGKWVDRPTVIREIERDHAANLLHTQQSTEFQTDSDLASQQWTTQWIQRNEHEAVLDHLTRADDAAEIQQILKRGRTAYMNFLRIDTAYNHALGDLHAQDGGDWNAAVDRTEFILWVADRGVDTLAGITPGGKGIKAVYSLYKGIGSGMSESLYAKDFHTGLGTVLKGAGEGFTDIGLDLVQDHVKLPFGTPKYDFSVEKLIERGLKKLRYLPDTGFNLPSNWTDKHPVIMALDALASGSRGYFLEDLTWKNIFKENVLGFDREYLLKKVLPDGT